MDKIDEFVKAANPYFQIAIIILLIYFRIVINPMLKWYKKWFESAERGMQFIERERDLYRKELEKVGQAFDVVIRADMSAEVKEKAMQTKKAYYELLNKHMALYQQFTDFLEMVNEQLKSMPQPSKAAEQLARMQYERSKKDRSMK